MTVVSVALVVIVVTAAALVILPRLRQLRLLYSSPPEALRRAPPGPEDEALFHTLGNAAADTIDDRTWRDLMMDDVFPKIDRTSSVIGRQMLLYRLRIEDERSDDRNRLRQRLSWFASSPQTVTRALDCVRRLNDNGHALLASFVFARVHRRARMHLVLPTLFSLSVFALIAGLIWPPALIGLLVVGLVNVSIRIWLHASLQAFVTPFRAVHELLDCAEALRAIECNSNLPVNPPASRDVRVLRHLSSLLSWAGRGDDDLLRLVFEYLVLLFCIDGLVFVIAAPLLRRGAVHLETAYLHVGAVDVALSATQLRDEMPSWCQPEWRETGPVILRGLWNPLVGNPTANDVSLLPGRGILLTGPHMSGKSTLVRSIGVALLCGRALDTCPATSAVLPHAKLWTSISHDDSIVEERSYHLTETQRLVQLLRAAAGDALCLFLLDEPMRGTNAAERIAIVATVLDFFVSRGHLALATTHDFELQALLDRKYQAYHLEGEAAQDALGYALRVGASQPRNALTLLTASGAPAEVVKTAGALCDALLAAERRLPVL